MKRINERQGLMPQLLGMPWRMRQMNINGFDSLMTPDQIRQQAPVVRPQPELPKEEVETPTNTNTVTTPAIEETPKPIVKPIQPPKKEEAPTLERRDARDQHPVTQPTAQGKIPAVSKLLGITTRSADIQGIQVRNFGHYGVAMTSEGKSVRLVLDHRGQPVPVRHPQTGAIVPNYYQGPLMHDRDGNTIHQTVQLKTLPKVELFKTTADGHLAFADNGKAIANHEVLHVLSSMSDLQLKSTVSIMQAHPAKSLSKLVAMPSNASIDDLCAAVRTKGNPGMVINYMQAAAAPKEQAYDAIERGDLSQAIAKMSQGAEFQRWGSIQQTQPLGRANAFMSSAISYEKAAKIAESRMPGAATPEEKLEHGRIALDLWMKALASSWDAANAAPENVKKDYLTDVSLTARKAANLAGELGDYAVGVKLLEQALGAHKDTARSARYDGPGSFHHQTTQSIEDDIKRYQELIPAKETVSTSDEFSLS